VRERTGPWLALVAGLGTALIGAAWLAWPAPPADVGVVPAPGPLRPAAATASASLPAPLARVPRPRPAVLRPAPVQVRLPRLRVTATVRPVSVGPTGALGVPTDPRVLGWWRSGARPGAGAGTVVIDGHVDSRRLGFGALFRLREMKPGDAVEVRDATGHWHAYRVVARREYIKRRLPASQVFAQGGRERLVLVTCGGSFDRVRRQYADNVVVYALPVRV
jgi:hypothetical protein